MYDDNYNVFGYFEGQEGLFMLSDNRPWNDESAEELAAYLAPYDPDCIYFLATVTPLST